MFKGWLLCLMLCCVTAACFKRNLPYCAVNQDDDCGTYGLGTCVAPAGSSYGVCSLAGGDGGDGGSTGGACELLNTLTGPSAPVRFGAALALLRDGRLLVGDPAVMQGGRGVAQFYADARTGNSNTALRGPGNVGDRFGQHVAALRDFAVIALDAAMSPANAVYIYDGFTNGRAATLNGASMNPITAVELAVTGIPETAPVTSRVAVGIPDENALWAGDIVSLTQLNKLMPTGTVTRFGSAVAMNAGFIAASDGNQNVQIFARNTTAWDAGVKLPPPAGAIRFGARLTMTETDLLVSGCAASGCQNDLYRFRFMTGQSQPVGGELLFSQPDLQTLALSGQVVVAGAPTGSGKAWVFSLAKPQQPIALPPSSMAALGAGAGFGTAVAVTQVGTDTLVAVGAPGEAGGGKVFVFRCTLP